MTERLLYVFDVDGVLADWAVAFTSLANRHFGLAIRSHGQQTEWDISGPDRWLTLEQETQIWSYIKTAPTWWETLPPLVTPGDVTAMHDLGKNHDLLYLTSRVGRHPGRQTERWLKDLGFPEAPVKISNDKAGYLEPFNAEHRVRIIEDRPATIAKLWDAAIHVTVRDWPYNRDTVPYCDDRVSSVAEFCGLG